MVNLNEKLEINSWSFDDYADYQEAAENHPWRVVASIDWENRPYSFCETRVYKDNRTGLLYLAFDTGCSCPKPFEDHTVADLTPLRTIADWYDHASMHRVFPDGYGDGTRLCDVQAVARQVRELLKEGIS